MTVRDICNKTGIGKKTVLNWVHKAGEEFPEILEKIQSGKVGKPANFEEDEVIKILSFSSHKKFKKPQDFLVNKEEIDKKDCNFCKFYCKETDACRHDDNLNKFIKREVKTDKYGKKYWAWNNGSKCIKKKIYLEWNKNNNCHRFEPNVKRFFDMENMVVKGEN